MPYRIPILASCKAKLKCLLMGLCARSPPSNFHKPKPTSGCCLLPDILKIQSLALCSTPPVLQRDTVSVDGYPGHRVQNPLDVMTIAIASCKVGKYREHQTRLKREYTCEIPAYARAVTLNSPHIHHEEHIVIAAIGSRRPS